MIRHVHTLDEYTILNIILQRKNTLEQLFSSHLKADLCSFSKKSLKINLSPLILDQNPKDLFPRKHLMSLWTVAQPESLPGNSQYINWPTSCAHTIRPMNLAWKRQHEELNSWSSRPSTKHFFPYRTQFQIIGPHRRASWANRQTGPLVSVCVSLVLHLEERSAGPPRPPLGHVCDEGRSYDLHTWMRPSAVFLLHSTELKV
jgi:hypothetical protein